MDYDKAIEFIKSTASMGSVLGLERLEGLLKLMDNPEDKLKYIHVAGTNGKGSTCSMLMEILKDAGYKVGVFSSPAISDFREQITIDGEMIGDKELVEVVTFIKDRSKDMKTLPTEFEITVAVAIEYFKRTKCDLVIMEVGMGGRDDATNIIPNKELAIITSISLDHCEFLGNTLEDIARIKGDITKNAKGVVCYPQVDKILKIIKEFNNNIYIADFDEISLIDEDISSQMFNYKDYKNISLNLIGEHQRYNAAVVIEAIKRLKVLGYKINPENVLEGFKKAKITARIETLCNEPKFILDGGHNVDSVRYAVETLSKNFKDKEIIFIIGVMADKDYLAMFDLIAPIAKMFIAVEPNNPRALKLDKLKLALEKYEKPVIAKKTIADGVKTAFSFAKTDDIICAIGSLYMAGEVKKCVLCQKK